MPKINSLMSPSGLKTISSSNQKGIKLRSLVIKVLNNWGDSEFVGLTELEVLDRNNQVIKYKC